MIDHKSPPDEGQRAYEAYIGSCPVSKFTGERLPAWADVDPDIKGHWAAVERSLWLHFIAEREWGSRPNVA